MILGLLTKIHLNWPKRTFDDVYGPGHNPTNYARTERTQRLTVNAENVYIHDCVFRNISTTGNGGALFCSSSVYKLLVEQSSFISCMTSNGTGGGIYFDNLYNGQCVMCRICAFNCSATHFGPFTQIQ